MSKANPKLGERAVAFSILLFVVGLFLFASIRQINHDLKQNADWQTYFVKDSMHYYSIAQGFAAGDFSMSYEKRWPYRQPLLPLMVAGVMKLNGDLFAIRLINVVIAVVTTFSLFYILRCLWSDSFSAAVIAALFILCPTTYDQSVHGLTTEPLHLFLLICAIACFLRYFSSGHWTYLWLLAFAIGLDQLDRINGMFVAISAFAVLLCFKLTRYPLRSHRAETAETTENTENAKDVENAVSAKRQTPTRRHADTPTRRHASHSWLHYLIAALILLATTIPSWLSRWHYFRNPFYYGPIQNFLWGDTYLGSMDAPRMLTAGDYFGSHSLFDVAARLLVGCWKVFFVIPIDQERLPILYFAGLAGIWIAWRQRRTEYLWLLLFYLVQMLPLAWTQPVNTTPRIPYAATQPFELFFAGLFVHWVLARRERFSVTGPDLDSAVWNRPARRRLRSRDASGM